MGDNTGGQRGRPGQAAFHNQNQPPNYDYESYFPGHEFFTPAWNPDAAPFIPRTPHQGYGASPFVPNAPGFAHLPQSYRSPPAQLHEHSVSHVNGPRSLVPAQAGYQGYQPESRTAPPYAARHYVDQETYNAHPADQVTDESSEMGRKRNRASKRKPTGHGQAAPQGGQARKAHRRLHRRNDEINAPSAESGGVPEPTPEYLARASQQPATEAGPPKKLLVVIDLNGTLLHRPNSRQPDKFIPRPEAERFLVNCIKTHETVIWSSAQEKNVKSMCNQLLGPELKKLVLAIWGREKFGLTDKDSAKRTMCYKRLTKLWADEKVKSKGDWDQGNTVLIDDSAEKARSEPYNAITLPEYTGEPEDPPTLRLVEEYLELLRSQRDVSCYMKNSPFKVMDLLQTEAESSMAPVNEDETMSVADDETAVDDEAAVDDELMDVGLESEEED